MQFLKSLYMPYEFPRLNRQYSPWLFDHGVCFSHISQKYDLPCVLAHTHVFVCVCELKCVNALVWCGGQRAALGGSFCFPFCLRQGLCCFPLCAQANWPMLLGILLLSSLVPQQDCWNSRYALAIWLSLDLGVRTLVPQACVGRASPTEPSPQTGNVMLRRSDEESALNNGWGPFKFHFSILLGNTLLNPKPH